MGAFFFVAVAAALVFALYRRTDVTPRKLSVSARLAEARRIVSDAHPPDAPRR